MKVIPAIDIIDGKAVRLYKGDYNKKEVVDNDVLKRALEFEQAGADIIHIVDLDGAKEGTTVNKTLILEIAKEVKTPIEVGGGIRTLEDIEEYLNGGVYRVILGTAAINDKNMLMNAVKKHGKKVCVGIDVKNGVVCGNGWLEESDRELIEFGKELKNLGVKSFIVTDISKDGTLQGTNIELMKTFSENVTRNVTASGGIKDINDVKNLIPLNIEGVIIGKAIYSGNLNLKEAVKITR